MNAPSPFQPPKSNVADVATPSTAMVPVKRYALAFLACFLVLLLGLGGMGKAFGISQPLVTSLIAVAISVCVASWLFVQKHHRQFGFAENARFTLGCGLAFATFDCFLSLAIRMSNGLELTGRQLTVSTAAMAVDFFIVWALVQSLALPLMRARARHEVLPNKSLERTREG